MPAGKRVNVTKIAASEKHHVRPKLGQHFLVDSGATARIVEALGDISESTVLEIGPGRGALTAMLARRARRLIAIEIDRVLAAQLRMNFSQEPNVEIIEGDVLAIDFHTLFGPKPGSTRPGMNHQPVPARVVGNLPYFITSDILLRLFEFRQYFETIVLMVQREVAERLAAAPGGASTDCFPPRHSFTPAWKNCSRFHLRRFRRPPRWNPRWCGCGSRRSSIVCVCPKTTLLNFSNYLLDRSERRFRTISRRNMNRKFCGRRLRRLE